MAVVNPPLWLQAGAYTARQDRRLIDSMVGSQGVAGTLDLLVSQRAAGANMSVDVQDGRAFILGGEATTQGTYLVEAQGATNVVLAAAHATLPRYDLIVARVRDAEYSGATNAWALEVVQGTAAGSPVEPTVPVSAITLARVLVAPAATSITNASITDRRPRARILGGVHVATSTTLPSLLDEGGPGELAYATDLDAIYVRTASAWIPFGVLYRATGTGLSISTSYQPVTNASLVLPAGKWLVQGKITWVSNSGSAVGFDGRLQNISDSTTLDEDGSYAPQSPNFVRPIVVLMGTLSSTTTRTVRLEGKVSAVTGTQALQFAKIWATPVTAIL